MILKCRLTFSSLIVVFVVLASPQRAVLPRVDVAVAVLEALAVAVSLAAVSLGAASLVVVAALALCSVVSPALGALASFSFSLVVSSLLVVPARRLRRRV